MTDGLNPPAMHHYYTAEWLHGLDDQTIGALVAAAGSAPSPHSSIILKRMGGAAGRVPADATPFWYRDAAYNLDIHAQWAPGSAPGAHITWARDTRQAARRDSAGGSYVNFIGAEDPGRVRAAYAGNYRRLAQVKAAYDPENFFRVNNNIPPAVPAGNRDRAPAGPAGNPGAPGRLAASPPGTPAVGGLMSSDLSSPAAGRGASLVLGEDPVAALEAASWALAAMIATMRDALTAPLADVLAAAPHRTAVLKAVGLVETDQGHARRASVAAARRRSGGCQPGSGEAQLAPAGRFRRGTRRERHRGRRLGLPGRRGSAGSGTGLRGSRPRTRHEDRPPAGRARRPPGRRGQSHS